MTPKRVRALKLSSDAETESGETQHMKASSADGVLGIDSETHAVLPRRIQYMLTASPCIIAQLMGLGFSDVQAMARIWRRGGLARQKLDETCSN